MNDILSQPGQKRITSQSWEVERRRYTHHQFCWPPQCKESLGGILSAPCTSCLSSCRWLSAAHQTPSEKESAIMGPTAGQLLINPLHQTQVQNPEFSQEDINKGNWPLLERTKEKRENIQQALKHAASLFLCMMQETVPHFPLHSYFLLWQALYHPRQWTSTGKDLFC